jgi:clan AA aspartic protease
VITGSVNSDREAVIRLELTGSGGQKQDTEAIIDTGFTGFLTLRPGTIGALGLSFRGRQQVLLGDGSVALTDVYIGTVDWDGQSCTIEVDSADTEPLVGMSLLYGYELRIQVVDGGTVTVDAL